MKLWEYVMENSEHGACTCGKCIDAPPNPENHQPNRHTVDLVFFKVAMKDEANPAIFKQIAQEEFPGWFDGKEHSYLQIGADMGDQGIALITMGLGGLLRVWKLLTPANLPINIRLQKEMAEAGYITIIVDDKRDKDGPIPNITVGDGNAK